MHLVITIVDKQQDFLGYVRNENERICCMNVGLTWRGKRCYTNNMCKTTTII